ncbi:MAG: hypothetical protein ACYCW5_05635, partial [Thermoleophilia bacterium]
DDPVGAVSVHGACGLWGVISLGIFADGTYGDGFNGVTGGVTGLLYGGGDQLASQMMGVAAVIAVAFGIGYAFFKVLDKTIGIRVSPEAEIQGLDIPEIGVLAYPDFDTSNPVSQGFASVSSSTVAPRPEVVTE